MQTALHILGLVDELNRLAVGGRIVSTEFYKKERTAYLFIKGRKGRMAFGFRYHPHGAGCFLVPASKVKIETREKPWPFFKLEGRGIKAVAQFGLDRVFKIIIDGEPVQQVVIEAIGPNGNLWLLDGSGGIVATLRKKDFTEGEPYEPAPLPDRLNPLELTVDYLKARVGEYQSLVALLDRQVMGFNQTLAREAVTRADIDFVPPGELTSEQWEVAVDAIKDLANRFKVPDIGYLYQMPKGYEAYPFKLRAADSDPEKHKTLSLAVLAFTSMRQAQVEQVDERKTVTTAVNRAVKRLEKRLVKLDADIEKAADYERYKKFGELLQINLRSIAKGQESVELDDVYLGGDATVTVRLDPALSPADNAEEYFKKYRKGREGLALLERRREVSRDELLSLREIQSALESDFDNAVKQFESDLANLLPKEGVRREGVARLPYREHVLSSGVKIFIGRDGSDNDRTTFEFARPYELWFHAQQCPGSHVVMKYPNKKFEPSKREIEETAAIAAYHSKARNDSLVPVVYTQRKYVRKPRKAKPGLVTVEREKSVMVEPKKPE